MGCFLLKMARQHSALLFLTASAAAACTSDFDCSLNGVCAAGACQCDQPWKGSSCGVLGFKTTPASAKDIYPSNMPANTWNGPIAGPDSDGNYHAFVPIYPKGKLFGAKTIKHGVSANITGPYDWKTKQEMPGKINPAFLMFKNKSSGELVYSLWFGGAVHIAHSLDGPFLYPPIMKYPGVNPAPLNFDGAFYMTNQHTKQVFRTPKLGPGGEWTLFSNISNSSVPAGVIPEDPFM